MYIAKIDSRRNLIHNLLARHSRLFPGALVAMEEEEEDISLGGIAILGSDDLRVEKSLGELTELVRSELGGKRRWNSEVLIGLGGRKRRRIKRERENASV